VLPPLVTSNEYRGIHMTSSIVTPTHPRFKNIAGEKYNHLTAISYSHINKQRQAMWICLCDCGNKSVVESYALRKGRTKSCGCVAKENPGNLRHGMRGHPLYCTWMGMKDRCSNPKNKKYKYYGDRGISVCKNWEISIDSFISDMGEKPTTKHSIDRINNDGNYEPGNCRWATSSQQNSNKRPKNSANNT